MNIKLLINTSYGKIGDIVWVHPSRGKNLVANKQAELVADDGPRRATKMHPENKSVGA